MQKSEKIPTFKNEVPLPDSTCKCEYQDRHKEHDASACKSPKDLNVNELNTNIAQNKTASRPEINNIDLSSYDKFIQKMDVIENHLKDTISEIINDPIVMQTNWLPEVTYGGSLRTHELKECGVGRMEFRATNSLKMAFITLILLGIGEAIYIFAINYISGTLVSGKVAAVLAISVVFVVVGAYLLIKRTSPIVFDLNLGFFWKGKIQIDKASDGYKVESFTMLKDVHALQLIPVLNPRSGDFSAYYSYELNLVLNDGKRISVVNHGDRDKLVSDAVQLATFIKKPVWNAIGALLDCYRSFKSK